MTLLETKRDAKLCNEHESGLLILKRSLLSFTRLIRLFNVINRFASSLTPTVDV
jgi:hypothetical protein